MYSVLNKLLHIYTCIKKALCHTLLLLVYKIVKAFNVLIIGPGRLLKITCINYLDWALIQTGGLTDPLAFAVYLYEIKPKGLIKSICSNHLYQVPLH